MTETAMETARARWRGGIYALLALAYHEQPDRGQFERLEACRDAARDAGLSAWERELETLVRLANAGPEEDLRQDFQDLFKVPTGKYVTPYESVYQDEPITARGKTKARTCGPSMVAACTFYERIGLQVAPGYPELRDYIGLELACMEYLCTREAEYREAGDEAAALKARGFQRSFLVEHLSAWFPKLEARIREKADTDYFRVLAAFTHAWLKEESETVSAGT